MVSVAKSSFLYGYICIVLVLTNQLLAEIPTLLAPTPAPGTEKKEATHLRALPHHGASSLDSDDGLGAFRPSTSFNDLSTLVPPNASVNNGKSPKMTPVVSSATLASKGTETKKRPAPISSAEGTAAKRRASGNSRKNVGGSKPKTKGASSKAGKGVFNGKPSNNTPNPLTAGGKLAVAAPGGNKPQPIKPIVKPPAVPLALPKVNTEENCSDMLPPAPTEADFKSVAQAAVSNLIANAGNKSENAKKSSSTAEDESVDKIDTSTEHIKALTGTNWVTVCSDGQSSNASADKMNNRARRQNLTPDERARQNRDRNREHARNTRLRKKAYVEELKSTLTALVSQRDAAELEKRHSSQREMEQREVRFRVVEEFLKLRGRNETNYSRWAAILEDTFTMTLPNTDYRDIAGERGHFEQKLCGVSQVMADSSMFAEFLQTLGKIGAGQPISFVYNCDRKNFFMDNCTAVMNWLATSCGATHQVRNSITQSNIFTTISVFSQRHSSKLSGCPS